MNPNNHETTKARNHENKTLRLFRVFVFSCSCGNAICEMASSQWLVRRIRLSTTADTAVLRVHRGGEVSIATARALHLRGGEARDRLGFVVERVEHGQQ